MQCPKEKKVALVNSKLSDQLAVQQCPSCRGNWIQGEEYASWQAEQPSSEAELPLIDRALEVECQPSSFDPKAALCPECNCYLARAKVSLKTPFYVERCPNCKGIWCDGDEWEVLETLGLHKLIDRLFATDWQMLVRERESLAQERRATIDKLGSELAARIFELADVLERHPKGDFGVAYLMRRFDK